MGLYNGDFAFITIDFSIEESWKSEPWYKTDEIFNGILNIGVKKGEEALGPKKFADFTGDLLKGTIQKFNYDFVARQDKVSEKTEISQ